MPWYELTVWYLVSEQAEDKIDENNFCIKTNNEGLHTATRVAIFLLRYWIDMNYGVITCIFMGRRLHGGEANVCTVILL